MPDMNLSSASAHPLLFLAGPTAVGKSAVAMLLAEHLGGEIISVDSMQVYRGLDIGTAKPPSQDRARIPHHLIDVAELQDSFDAAQFVKLSSEAVAKIRAGGHLPIFCGGTGLYFKAFLDGLGDAPPADPKLRAQLEALPVSVLLQEVQERDPVTYERIDRQNLRRVIRAVEVLRLTGKPFSEQRADWSKRPRAQSEGKADALERGRLIGLARSTADLAGRINLRVDEMFHRGLVQETQLLLRQGLAQNRTALQALGYRQVTEYLQGMRSLPETIELVKTRTRQFAKRQMTWFRRQLPVEWIEVKPTDSCQSVSGRIQEVLG